MPHFYGNASNLYDVIVIGGGIIGAGCAADAALRGLSVFLAEKNGIASGTSSRSSKLVHGGLRYLESYNFSMVKQALDERHYLLQAAPHLVRSQPFLLPHGENSRSPWLIGAGLTLYDHLSRKNNLPSSAFTWRSKSPSYFMPLKAAFKKGFIFYDARTDDVLLTKANALQAQQHGAIIRPHTELIGAKVAHGQWCLTMQPSQGKTFQVQARAVVNAAGPWVESVAKRLNTPCDHGISLVQGSHLVVRKLYEGEQSYLLQHQDGRVVFIVPFYGETMVGTTDVTYTGNPDAVCITDDEIDYLINLVRHYFIRDIHKSDILHVWSGVRPLLSSANEKNPSALSRDYALQYSQTPASIVTIYGGKLTIYRQLAEQAINLLRPVFPSMGCSQSRDTPLPGATLGTMSFTDYQQYAREKYSWLEQCVLDRYLQHYGTRTEELLLHCGNMQDLGICFAPGFYQVEVDHLISKEWSDSLDKLLWADTKIGLVIQPEGRAALAEYLSDSIRRKPSQRTDDFTRHETHDISVACKSKTQPKTES